MRDKKTGIPVKRAKPRKKPAVARAKAGSLKSEVFVQFQGGEISIAALVDAAKDDFRQAKKHARITGIKLYVKPEEYTAYYVINEGHEGKVTF